MKPLSPAELASLDQELADRESADLMLAVASIDISSADGRAGMMSLLTEMERREPGSLDRLRAHAEIQRAARRMTPGRA